jgi:hypothetical protein
MPAAHEAQLMPLMSRVAFWVEVAVLSGIKPLCIITYHLILNQHPGKYL